MLCETLFRTFIMSDSIQDLMIFLSLNTHSLLQMYDEKDWGMESVLKGEGLESVTWTCVAIVMT